MTQGPTARDWAGQPRTVTVGRASPTDCGRCVVVLPSAATSCREVVARTQSGCRWCWIMHSAGRRYGYTWAKVLSLQVLHIQSVQSRVRDMIERLIEKWWCNPIQWRCIVVDLFFKLYFSYKIVWVRFSGIYSDRNCSKTFNSRRCEIEGANNYYEQNWRVRFVTIIIRVFQMNMACVSWHVSHAQRIVFFEQNSIKYIENIMGVFVSHISGSRSPDSPYGLWGTCGGMYHAHVPQTSFLQCYTCAAHWK